MKKLSGWQKAGIAVGVGCASIVVVLVGGVIIAVIWARSTVAELGDTSPTSVDRAVVLEKPAGPAPEGPPAGAVPPADGRRQHLTIELEEGSFTVLPGPPGGSVKVEGSYSKNLFELTERTETDANGTSRTTIRFRPTVPIWVRMLARIGSDGSRERPEVTIAIPADVPIDLSLRVATGESRVDLGGLMLGDVGVDLAMGNHELDFRKPAAAEAGRMQLTTSMGNITISNLGNARAKAIDANGSMGNLTVDLGGAWQPGANADLSFTQSMGEVTVNVPKQVRLEAQITRSESENQNRQPEVDPDETTDPEAPVVRLRLTTSMGDGRVVRY